MPDPGPELVLDGLGKRYDRFAAVEDVTLSIGQGEFTTILGPSGSGKTTTLMMVAGFTYPTSGRVLLRGQEITFMPPHRRGLGMVFQNYALFPHLDVAENVAFPLRMRGASREETRRRVAAALALVQLEAHAAKPPAQLSGGQQQRAALARAMVYGPSLLLMDEPLGALDKALREHMQSQIKRIQQATGVTIVSVTHDQDEALAMSDRVVVMDGGRVRAAASPAELYERPPNAFVAQFVGETNLLRGRVEARQGSEVLVRLPQGLELRLHGHAAPGAEVALSIRPERIACSTVPGAPGALAATVAQATYLGDVVRYHLDVPSPAGPLALVVKTLGPRGGRVHAPGTQVFASWSQDDAWLLPEEPA